MKKLKKILAAASAALFAAGGAAACREKDARLDAKRGMNAYAFTKASYAAIDREGRAVTEMHGKKNDHDRYVGIFYWPWIGTMNTTLGIHDITKLQKTEEGKAAVLNPALRQGDYLADYYDEFSSQSPTEYCHWTNQPLYGYYNSCDRWVIARHIELLTAADIDFIFLDTTNDSDFYTNGFPHSNAAVAGSPVIAFLDTVLEYQGQGWDVPKVVFYTNTNGKNAVNNIFAHYYAGGKYDSIWFKPKGKPMIVGTTEKNRGASDAGTGYSELSYITADMQSYFDVRESQWPSMSYKDWGFPWMDWGHNFYFSENKVMNVSAARHGQTATSFNHGDHRSSRGYVSPKNKGDVSYIAEDWWKGQNIEDQWEIVLGYDNKEEPATPVEYVTVTGWNQWYAWKHAIGGKIVYIDGYNAEFSWDIEMDKEYYKDNFYLQLVRNVRRYKYGGARADGYAWPTKTPKVMTDFNGLSATYKDMSGDARARDFWSADLRPGKTYYTDGSNRNDITEIVVTHDKNNVYFRVSCKEDITPYQSGENWMNLLIKTKNSTAQNSWEGYDYIINRSPENGKASVDKSAGGWNWAPSGAAEMKIEGGQMMITVPLSALGLTAGNVSFEFKAADNVTDYKDIMDYYVTGDSAPIGRLNYSYGY